MSISRNIVQWFFILPVISNAKLKYNLCDTLVAAKMISSMDMSVNPCDDFFEYACGGWRRSHVIPEDKAVLGTFYELRDDVDIKIKGKENELNRKKL